MKPWTSTSGHADARHGDADLVAVGQREDVAGEPGGGDQPPLRCALGLGADDRGLGLGQQREQRRRVARSAAGVAAAPDGGITTASAGIGMTTASSGSSFASARPMERVWQGWL